MEVYKVSYSDWDEYDYIYLTHRKKFSNDELRMMIYECIKEIVKEKEYTTPPCLLSVANFFNEYDDSATIGRKMIKKYGFSYFHFQATASLDNFKIFKGPFCKIYELDKNIQCCRNKCTFEKYESHECPCTNGDKNDK